jgi:hypothetical protein
VNFKVRNEVNFDTIASALSFGLRVLWYVGITDTVHFIQIQKFIQFISTNTLKGFVNNSISNILKKGSQMIVAVPLSKKTTIAA